MRARATHAPQRGAGRLVAFRALALGVGVGLAGCASGARREPPNLETFKEQAKAYVASGDYERAIAAVAREGRTWLERRAASGGARLTVVFDIDETLLSNWPSIVRQDFGYVPTEWERWVEAAEAPAIGPMRDLVRDALRLNLEVVLITGRRDRNRAATERNLRAAGCDGYALLICQPDDDHGSSAAFKTTVRRRLTAEGRTIIANLGDQDSDLAGGFAERTFKLPNPFYRTD